jgi:hypothetical protein
VSPTSRTTACQFGIAKTDGLSAGTFRETKNPLCFTEIGTGTLTIQDIIDVADQLPNLQCLLLEQDNTQMTELESIGTSQAAFSRYVSW